MSRSRTVFTNAAIIGVREISLTLLAVFVVGFMARMLGPKDYGTFSLAFAFPELFLVIGSMGLRPLTIREVSRKRGESGPYLQKMLPLRLILVAAMSVVSVAVSLAFGYDDKVLWAIAIAVVCAFFDQLSKIVTDLFQAIEEVWRISVRDLVVKLLISVLTILVLLPFFGGGLYWVCAIYTLGALVGFSINLWMLEKRFQLGASYTFDLSFVKKQLKSGVPYILMGFASVLILRADIVILSKLKGMESVGEYNAALTIVRRLFVLPDVIATVAFPAIADLFISNPGEAKTVCGRTSAMIAGTVLPLAVGGFMLAEPITLLIFGNQYRDSVAVFKVLLISLPIMAYATFFSYILGAINQEVYAARAMIFMAVLNVLLNFLLIPSYGPAGSAAASLIAHVLGLAALLVPIRKHLYLWDKAIDFAAIGLGLLLMAAVVFLLKEAEVVVRILAGGLVYGVCIAAVERKRLKNFRKPWAAAR